MTDVRAVLAEVAMHPRADWKRLLADRLGDPSLVRQGLLWLVSDAIGRSVDRPPLGGDGEARYELVAALDRGATATVWQARDRVLDRAVAIKVFHENAAAIVDVLREARAASDVVSDHVVRVLDVCDGEHPYLVMELVAEHDGELQLGRSAADMPPRDLEEAVRWTLHVARGVADAHLRNVFHRDLNPRNVLVGPLSRRARIADFGLAASQHARAGIRGTPAYLAPEQARGAPLDRAALVAVDIWGIGATARDLIAGQPPWPASDTPWEHAAAGGPLPPLVRSRTGERIPRTLARIVDKLTAPLAAERYGSAREVVAELSAYLADRPTSFDQGRVRRARLWARRNPQVTLAGVVTVGLLVVLAGSFVGLATLDRERDDLEVERDRVTEHLRSINEELVATDSALARRTTELRALERSLADQQAEYLDVLAAKEHALRQARARTSLLVGRLEDLEDDRTLAESTGKLYERFWTTARAEADTATRERMRMQGERDAARAELAALHAKLDELQGELDRARATLPPPASSDDEPPPARVE